MSFMTDASDDNGDGDTQAKPVAGLKTHHNLSIVYIDHELDKPIAESNDDGEDIGTSRSNLTVVYIDHHLDGSAPSDSSQDFDGSNLFANQGAVMQSQQGLFRLPPELRIPIWELILPGRRLLKAKARYGRDRRDDHDEGSSSIKGCQGRWNFRLSRWLLCDAKGHLWPSSLKVPTALKICKESRSIALKHGLFIFGQRGSQETGTWWNPDLDVLGFDRSWDIDQHPWALANLDGLEHVKHVAIDEEQAWTICYNAGYNGSYPLEIPRDLCEPLAVTFEFRASKNRNHYILDFFPHFQQLTILFSTIYDDHWQLWRELHGRDYFKIYVLDEDEYCVTFRPGSDIQTAVAELRKYRELCMRTVVQEPHGHGLDEFVDGPVYSVKNDDVDIDNLDHWMGAGFGMCQADQDVPI